MTLITNFTAKRSCTRVNIHVSAQVKRLCTLHIMTGLYDVSQVVTGLLSHYSTQQPAEVVGITPTAIHIRSSAKRSTLLLLCS